MATGVTKFGTRTMFALTFRGASWAKVPDGCRTKKVLFIRTEWQQQKRQLIGIPTRSVGLYWLFWKPLDLDETENKTETQKKTQRTKSRRESWRGATEKKNEPKSPFWAERQVIRQLNWFGWAIERSITSIDKHPQLAIWIFRCTSFAYFDVIEGRFCKDVHFSSGYQFTVTLNFRVLEGNYIKSIRFEAVTRFESDIGVGPLIPTKLTNASEQNKRSQIFIYDLLFWCSLFSPWRENNAIECVQTSFQLLEHIFFRRISRWPTDQRIETKVPVQ